MAIDQIHKETFRNLVGLKTIDLANNKIESIDPSTFDGLVKLETLLLSSNQIKVIHKDTFRNLVGQITLIFFVILRFLMSIYVIQRYFTLK